MKARQCHRRWRLFAADLCGSSPTLLNDVDELERLLHVCLAETSISTANWIRHCFEPQGVSLFAFGKRCRLAVHTWPELRSATVDLWTPEASGAVIIERCIAALGARTRLSRTW